VLILRELVLDRDGASQALGVSRSALRNRLCDGAWGFLHRERRVHGECRDPDEPVNLFQAKNEIAAEAAAISEIEIIPYIEVYQLIALASRQNASVRGQSSYAAGSWDCSLLHRDLLARGRRGARPSVRGPTLAPDRRRICGSVWAMLRSLRAAFVGRRAPCSQL
jgi:hypothetical protein